MPKLTKDQKRIAELEGYNLTLRQTLNRSESDLREVAMKDLETRANDFLIEHLLSMAKKIDTEAHEKGQWWIMMGRTPQTVPSSVVVMQRVSANILKLAEKLNGGPLAPRDGE